MIRKAPVTIMVAGGKPRASGDDPAIPVLSGLAVA